MQKKYLRKGMRNFLAPLIKSFRSTPFLEGKYRTISQSSEKAARNDSQ